MRFNDLLHLIAFSGKAHGRPPASGFDTTKMPDSRAFSNSSDQFQPLHTLVSLPRGNRCGGPLRLGPAPEQPVRFPPSGNRPFFLPFSRASVGSGFGSVTGFLDPLGGAVDGLRRTDRRTRGNPFSQSSFRSGPPFRCFPAGGTTGDCPRLRVGLVISGDLPHFCIGGDSWGGKALQVRDGRRLRTEDRFPIPLKQTPSSLCQDRRGPFRKLCSRRRKNDSPHAPRPC